MGAEPSLGRLPQANVGHSGNLERLVNLRPATIDQKSEAQNGESAGNETNKGGLVHTNLSVLSPANRVGIRPWHNRIFLKRPTRRASPATASQRRLAFHHPWRSKARESRCPYVRDSSLARSCAWCRASRKPRQSRRPSSPITPHIPANAPSVSIFPDANSASQMGEAVSIEK